MDDFGSDSDGGFPFFFFIELPWQIWLLVLIVVIGVAVYDHNKTPEQRAQECRESVSPYNLDSKYEEPYGCLVKVDKDTWKAFKKFKKDGVVKDDSIRH